MKYIAMVLACLSVAYADILVIVPAGVGRSVVLTNEPCVYPGKWPENVDKASLARAYRTDIGESDLEGCGSVFPIDGENYALIQYSNGKLDKIPMSFVMKQLTGV